MDPERWKRIDEIFHAALEREAPSRAAFLAEACKEDDSLREEVEDLLLNHEKQSSLFDSPPTDLAAELLTRQRTFKGAVAHYQIVKRIGNGGMGEVYLAEDTRLNRKVALKILPSEFTQDKDRVRRFEREARAVSGLNHPNILTIYDIGQFDSSSFIASEYIDGETLRQRMTESKLSLKEVLTIGIQAAEALDAAHQAGVIHRDIKPENIMLRKDGYVKVLDFGLAKLAEKQNTPGISDLDTRTGQTQAGIVIGTVRYMSPEQARGLKVDARGDIFSLGIVLHEMIAARPPFDGATSSDVIAAILEKHPPPLHMYGDFPDELQWIVTKALAKDPEERYQTAKELLTDLKLIKKHLDVDELRRSDPSKIVQPVRKAKWATAALLALIAIAVSYFWYGKVSPKIAASKIPFSKIKLSRVTSSGKAHSGKISRDGKYISYVKDSLFLKHRVSNTEIEILKLPRDSGFSGYRFSPDGEYIYYLANSSTPNRQALYRIPVLGGLSIKLSDEVYYLPALSPDGEKLAFVKTVNEEQGLMQGLMLANSDGSNQQKIKSLKPPNTYEDLEWSPDGRILAAITESGRIVEMDSDKFTERPLSDLQLHMDYPPDLSWLPDGTGLMFTARKDGRRQVYFLSYPEGKIIPVTNDFNDYEDISISKDLRFLATTQNNFNTSIWSAPSKSPNSVVSVTSGSAVFDGYWGISWTPETKILYSSMEPGGDHQIWQVDRDGTNRKPITSGKPDKYWPVISPNGQLIAYMTYEGEIWLIDKDGSNSKLLADEKTFLRFPRFSPDSKWIICSTSGSDKEKQELLKIRIEDGTKFVVASHKYILGGLFSVDGLQIAYIHGSDASTDAEIRIISSADGAPIRTYHLDQSYPYGARCQWTPDGKGIAYIRDSNIYIQPLDQESPFALTHLDNIVSFSWSQDGKYIAYSRGEENSDVVLIENMP